MIGVSDALDISSLSSCLNFVSLGQQVDEYLGECVAVTATAELQTMWRND